MSERDALPPLNNAQIAALFDELADWLEFEGANAFRIRAYRNAARTIRDYPGSIAALAREDPKQLIAIEGIGKGVAEKCHALVETGQIPQLEELRRSIPPTVLEIMRIPGIGPKKAKALFDQLNIRTIDDLRKACESHHVQDLKGFGPKTEASIVEQLGRADFTEHRIYWADADAIAQQLREYLAPVESVGQLAFAGSYRRGKETVGDLDLLAESADPGPVMDRLAAYPLIGEVMLRGDTKMSVRLQSGLQVDLRVVPSESFGAALQYFTGSKAHNVTLRHRAKQQGLKINEYGVFRIDDESETYIGGRVEEEVYAALGLPCFPPEIREDRFEFEWAEEGPLPELVAHGDLRGDLHMHTSATDGRNTLREMAQAAIARGLRYIAITDHSKRVSMAHGLDADRLRAQWREIDELNTELGRRLKVLKGVECDILEDGRLDLADDVLAEADWVVASVHYGQSQPRDQITARIVGALEHRSVHCIAHPTGRLLNRRPPYDVDMEAVIAAAATEGKMLELNANPARLALNDIHCRAAQRLGVPIVISSDAHSTAGLDVLRYGILQARRGGLTASDVANTLAWSQFRKLIRAR